MRHEKVLIPHEKVLMEHELIPKKAMKKTVRGFRQSIIQLHRI